MRFGPGVAMAVAWTSAAALIKALELPDTIDTAFKKKKKKKTNLKKFLFIFYIILKQNFFF